MDIGDDTELDPPSNPRDAFDDPRVWEVVSEFQRELELGRRPDRALYINRYPDLAAAITNCLDGLQALHVELAQNPAQPPRANSQILQDAILKQTAAPLGDFQILSEIARGGMGIVYEAVQLSLSRRVALKVLPFASTIDPRHLQRFKIEAQAAALLHHTHIVPIYAVGCERGVHFYAMQLIEGQSLAAVLRGLRAQEGRETTPEPTSGPHNVSASVNATQDLRVGAFAPRSNEASRSTVHVSAVVTAGNSLISEGYIRRAARLIIQAADALEHAHQSGVVHRDIKPANLLVDRTGNLWVTDFGLAQLQNDNGVTRPSEMVGTFRYMSPEQMGGQRTVLDHRTDIYSLGATFYELVTLEPVFSASSHQELFYQILHIEPKRPREFNRAVPFELETIILKALSKQPADRYATAAEFAGDLQRFLDHKPILAKRPSPLERLRKWTKRHPSVVVASMLVLLIVALGSLTGNWLISREQSKTARALAGQRLRTEEAEARFKQARQAVDVLFQISEEELTDRPMEDVRKRILEVVLTHYEEFIEQRSNDPASQAELAKVKDKVKTILHQLNTLQSAMDHRLLEHPVVRKELKLTSTQEAQVQELMASWREEFRSDDPKRHDPSEAESAWRTRLVTIAERREQELESLLTAEQLFRFRQLAIQARGIFAFKDHEVVRILKLTPEQRSQIRGIIHEMFADLLPPRGPSSEFGFAPPPKAETDRQAQISTKQQQPGTGGTNQRSSSSEPWWYGPNARDRKPMKDWVAKALALLTEEQMQKWRSLTGGPLEELQQIGFPGHPPR